MENISSPLTPTCQLTLLQSALTKKALLAVFPSKPPKEAIFKRTLKEGSFGTQLLDVLKIRSCIQLTGAVCEVLYTATLESHVLFRSYRYVTNPGFTWKLFEIRNGAVSTFTIQSLYS